MIGNGPTAIEASARPGGANDCNAVGFRYVLRGGKYAYCPPRLCPMNITERVLIAQKGCGNILGTHEAILEERIGP